MKTQFQVLYRQFLFRVVDLELLATDAQGDVNSLLGQFAALLIFISMVASTLALPFSNTDMPRMLRLIGTLTLEHLLIATTMLTVGVFAVLSWDSTFPDRRDVLVLAPLPVPARTLFLAKVAASASALSLTVAVLNLLTGITWPFALLPPHGGVLGFLRSFTAYWFTMFASGMFIYCSVLCLQGFAAQLLSRRSFLRVSAFLQIAVFCLFVTVYFLQPPFAGLSELLDPDRQRLLSWLPSYCFLGLMQQVNGTLPAALAPLAQRAWAGLAIVACGAALAFFLSWFRTLRRIVEEPDIVAGSIGAFRLPRFGDSVQTAIVQFSIRTLFRSRQHRLILAFYLGIGFALVSYFLKTPIVRKQLLASAETLLGSQPNAPLLASTIVMLGFCLVGMRVVFAMPRELPANWIFRVAPIRGAAECLRANRMALLILGWVPVWTVSAMLLLSIWPAPAAAGHLMVLLFCGLILAELCLHDFRKIPFTCSYLPGRSNIHMTLWFAILAIVNITDEIATWELDALCSAKHFIWMLGLMCLLVIIVKRQMAVQPWDDGPLVFEKVDPSRVVTLGITGPSGPR